MLTVGNGMMGDDGAGALLAQRLLEAPVPGWEALHGGAAPENHLHALREAAPQRVVVFDAADMDAAPGTVRRIDDEQLEDPFFITTHSLPLTYLIEALREFVPQVEFVGIQPETVAFGLPMSDEVRRAVEQFHQQMLAGILPWED